MNADHFYSIGKDHETCQDYALSGIQGNFGYIIVCDGCSSSPDVDFGARMLALSARETLRIARGSPLDYETFGVTAIRKADTVSAILPLLSPDFLDSTLLIAWVDNGILTAHLYGDGMFFHKTEKSLRVVRAEFKVTMEGVVRPAPAYLSYYLDAPRKESYDALVGTKEVYDCIVSADQNESGIESGTNLLHKPFDPLVIQAPVAPGDMIAVCSDGINSFRNPDDTTVPWQQLVNDYVGFKNYEGVFVRRRMAAFQRKCQKQLVTHSDDISVAAIVI